MMTLPFTQSSPTVLLRPMHEPPCESGCCRGLKVEHVPTEAPPKLEAAVVRLGLNVRAVVDNDDHWSVFHGRRSTAVPK